MRLYRAVIENNKDPEEQGRYQVRIFGLQDGNKSGFETTNTEELPWAECIGTTAFGLIGEVGVSSIMHQGTWVAVAELAGGLHLGGDARPALDEVLGDEAGVVARAAGDHVHGFF